MRSAIRKYALVLLWLVGLLLAPLALEALASETEIFINYSPTQIYVEVSGTRLEIPRDKLPGNAQTPPNITFQPQPPQPPADSLYWQPAQANALGFLGQAGEWLQSLRPSAHWAILGTSASSAGTVYKARLIGGRTSARIDVSNGTTGYAFIIRAERRSISWWRLENSQPVEQLAGAIYRPSGRNSVRDLLAEVLLIGVAASVLAFLCWIAGLIGERVRTAKAQRAQSTQSVENGGETGVSAIVRRLSSVLGRAYYPPLAFFVGGTLVAAVACVLVLDAIPHVQDDVAYIFQGRIFAAGCSWVPVPPGPEFFANGFIQMFDGRWFTKYPPGYPLMLVPGLWAGLPWLINPLSAGVALALVYMAGRRMYGAHVAAWAGLLGLLSPWVIFMSGSYMSHPTTMMWIALFLYALVCVRGEQTPRLLWPLVAGFAMGMAFITREWTAIGIGVGAAAWAVGDLAFTGGRLRWAKLGRYALLLVGFAPPLLFLLYENRQLTGDWFRLAQDLVGSYDTPGFGPGHGDAQGHTPALGVYNTLVYLRTLATVFNGWPAPLALAPILLGLFAWLGDKSRRRLAWDALNALCALGLVGAYFLWWSSTTIFGPRYWYEGMPFFLLLAGRGFDLLGRLVGRALDGVYANGLRWTAPGSLFALLMLYNLSQSLPYQASQYEDYNGVSAAPLRNAERAGLKNALVFVALDPAKPNRDYGKVFFANDPLLRGDRIYVRDLGPQKNRALIGQFPGRAPYWLPLEGPPQPGVGPASRR